MTGKPAVPWFRMRSLIGFLRAMLELPGKRPPARMIEAEVLRVAPAALPDNAPTKQPIVTQVVWHQVDCHVATRHGRHRFRIRH